MPELKGVPGLLSSTQEVGTPSTFVFLKRMNTSLIVAGCSGAVTQQRSFATLFAEVAALLVNTSHQQRQGLHPDSPIWHNNLLLRVFSTISKGSAHLQIKTPTGTALLCPGCGWNMTPVFHSDLPAHFHGAGTALLGLAPSTLSPQRSLLLWGLLGRSGGKRSRHHPEHIPLHTPSCSTSLEGIPLGAGCPAPAKGH